MTRKLSEDTKRAIRERVPILDLVSQHVSLTRAGKYYKGLCPFHDDSNPSLQVDPAGQWFKCYGCDAKGDVFGFIQRLDGLTFPDAKALLAGRAGIDIDSNPSTGRGTGKQNTPSEASERPVRDLKQKEAQPYAPGLNVDDGDPVKRLTLSYGLPTFALFASAGAWAIQKLALLALSAL